MLAQGESSSPKKQKNLQFSNVSNFMSPVFFFSLTLTYGTAS